MTGKVYRNREVKNMARREPKPLTDIQKAAYSERCKHNMIFGTCGYCNEYEYDTVVKVPIPLKNEDGSPKMRKDGQQAIMFLEREVVRKKYVKWS